MSLNLRVHGTCRYIFNFISEGKTVVSKSIDIRTGLRSEVLIAHDDNFHIILPSNFCC